MVTLANPLNLTGYAEPLYVVHRIEDMSLVSDVEISGRLRLARPCPTPMTPPIPWCPVRSSSATCGRVYQPVRSKAWTNVWSDYLIGDQSTAQYNDTVLPIQVTNRAACRALGHHLQLQHHLCAGREHVGQIAVGT